MSLRVKLFLLGALLFLAVGTTTLTARATVGAIQNFQKQHTLIERGDVRTIEPWMTLPYVAHLYHVPESYLYSMLHIPKGEKPPRHTTLQALSGHHHQSVDTLIHHLQTAIQSYRKLHPKNPPHLPPVKHLEMRLHNIKEEPQ